MADPENGDDTLNKSELMRAVCGKKEITAKALDLLVNERWQVLLTTAGRAMPYRLAPDANVPMHMGAVEPYTLPAPTRSPAEGGTS